MLRRIVLFIILTTFVTLSPAATQASPNTGIDTATDSDNGGVTQMSYVDSEGRAITLSVTDSLYNAEGLTGLATPSTRVTVESYNLWFYGTQGRGLSLGYCTNVTLSDGLLGELVIAREDRYVNDHAKFFGTQNRIFSLQNPGQGTRNICITIPVPTSVTAGIYTLEEAYADGVSGEWLLTPSGTRARLELIVEINPQAKIQNSPITVEGSKGSTVRPCISAYFTGGSIYYTLAREDRDGNQYWNTFFPSNRVLSKTNTTGTNNICFDVSIPTSVSTGQYKFNMALANANSHGEWLTDLYGSRASADIIINVVAAAPTATNTPVPTATQPPSNLRVYFETDSYIELGDGEHAGTVYCDGCLSAGVKKAFIDVRSESISISAIYGGIGIETLTNLYGTNNVGARVEIDSITSQTDERQVLAVIIFEATIAGEATLTFPQLRLYNASNAILLTTGETTTFTIHPNSVPTATNTPSPTPAPNSRVYFTTETNIQLGDTSVVGKIWCDGCITDSVKKAFIDVNSASISIAGIYASGGTELLKNLYGTGNTGARIEIDNIPITVDEAQLLATIYFDPVVAGEATLTFPQLALYNASNTIVLSKGETTTFTISDTPPTATPIPTATTPPEYSCESDVNGDKAINVLDVQAVANLYNKAQGDEGYNPLYDINGDGIINILDVQIVSGNVGKPPICD